MNPLKKGPTDFDIVHLETSIIIGTKDDEEKVEGKPKGG